MGCWFNGTFADGTRVDGASEVTAVDRFVAGASDTVLDAVTLGRSAGAVARLVSFEKAGGD